MPFVSSSPSCFRLGASLFRGILSSFLLLNVLGVPSQAQLAGAPQTGQNLVVTRLDDPDPSTGCTVDDCSLRQAVTYANTNADANIITFKAGLSGTLSLSLGTISLIESVTISGPGSDVLSIVPTPGYQHFSIPSGGRAFAVSGVTIRDGDVSRAGVGTYGNFQTLGNLSLTDVVFSGNRASGGALDVEGGNLTLENCTFTNNRASSGGAFSFFGSGACLVRNCMFSGNNASNSGGAIYSFGNSFTIENSTFTNNSAQVNGGAVNSQNLASLKNCSFSGNSATQGKGGAFNGFQVMVESSSFSQNSAPEGGALFADAADVTGSTFTNNSATRNGGAVNFARTSLSGVVRNSTFTGNTANANGGAIFCRQGTVSVQNSTLNGNRAVGSTSYSTSLGDVGGFGGAIFNDLASTSLQNSTLTGNTAKSGGGVANASTMVIRFSTITANTSTTYEGGGGIAAPGGAGKTVQVGHTIVAGNQAINGDADDVAGSPTNFQSAGYNIIGAGTALTAFSASGDQPGVTDPGLKSFSNYGGATKTFALRSDSPARDAGNPSATDLPEFDQRGTGFSRVVGSRVDIGSFERQEPSSVQISDIDDQTMLQDTSRVVPFTVAAASSVSVSSDNSSLLPSGSLTVSGSGANRNLTIAPAASGRGTATVTVTVTDGATSATDTFLLTVTELPSLVVTTLSDAASSTDGLNSLREAVTYAARKSGADTVTFNVTGTLTLTRGWLEVGSSTTIQGPGLASLAITSSQNERVFIVPTGQSAAIKGLTLRDCINTSTANVILNRGTLAVENCAFRNNRVATLNPGQNYSGVIYNGGSLTVLQTTFDANRPAVGGVLLNAGTLTLRSGTFSNGTTENDGSALVNLGTGTVEASTFTNNSTAGGGSAVQNLDGATLSIKSTTFSSNSSSQGYAGGAISNAGTLNLDDSTLTGNSATIGGAVWNGGSFIVRRSVFRNNTALDSGAVYNNGTLIIEDSSVLGNSSQSAAAAIGNLRTATLLRSTLAGNIGTEYGALVNEGNLTLDNSTVTGNTSAASPAVTALSGTVTVRHSTITNNTSEIDDPYFGNGITVLGSATALISHSILAGNGFGNDVGGDATITSQGYNLIRGGARASDFNAPGDQKGIADAKLGTLADNGGPTETVALLVGSPAIDAGDPAFDASGRFDQRGTGFPRLKGTRVDIGAFEAPTSPILSFSNASTLEGNSVTPIQLQFPISVSSAPTTPIRVKYATSNGSALAGSDFTSASGTLTIAAGVTSGTVVVPILGEMINEPDETFTLTFSDLSGAVFSNGQSSLSVTGTIRNDDAVAVLIASGVTQAEGNSGSSNFQFKVSLSAPSNDPVTLNYATNDDTAIAGSDYTSTSGTLTIPAGSTSGIISVPVSGDNDSESDESFNLTLSSPSGAGFTGGVATQVAVGRITNDDPDTTPAATNVTSSVTIYKSGLARNRVTGRYMMSLVIQNKSTALDGPLYVALDGLNSNISMYNPDGFTLRSLPAGSPFRKLILPGVSASKPDGFLAAGAVLSVSLEVVNPTGASLSFTPRLLQGPGTP